MKIRNLGIPLATALLAACVTSPTGRSQLMVVSDSQMSQMGLAAFNDMRKQGKFVDAPRERAYATCVSRALVAVLPPPWNTQQWEVQIVGDDTANAFALPGGRIGVNKGMFKLADNQDQLAVVLGHELSHVVARHGAERVSDNMAAQAAVAAGTVYAGSRGGDANTAAALLGAGAELSILLPFSRTQESEADTWASATWRRPVSIRARGWCCGRKWARRAAASRRHFFPRIPRRATAPRRWVGRRSSCCRSINTHAPAATHRTATCERRLIAA